MKKILFIFIAVFAISFAKAQDIHFGAKTGLNLAKNSISDNIYNDIQKYRTAFHAGMLIEVAFSDKFSLQPEILYNSVGSVSEEGTTIDWIINYLSVPVMAKYYVADGFSLEAGPQIGFLLGSKMKKNTDEIDVKKQTESTDFGLGFGAGYKMENGLFFEARYTLGLSNISKTAGEEDWVKNNAIQFSVGFMFN